MTAAIALGAGAESSAARPKVRILSDSQTALKKGLRAKVTARHAGIVEVRAFSTTFDAPKSKQLTKATRVSFAGAGSQVVKLALNKSGHKAVASCEARELRVRAGGASDSADMKRNTKQCKPGKVDLSKAKLCDFIGQQKGSLCMLPFPDDFYTVRDSSTQTKRRINFKSGAMPQNVGGTPMNPVPYGLNDGFSPGQTILLRVPGLDNPKALAKTGAAPINHLGRYLKKNAPIVVINASTGERWPIWAELDSNAAPLNSTTVDPKRTALEIHPAVNFESGDRYIVALRNLKNPKGKKIGAPAGFRYYRDQLPSKKGAINKQRKRFENVFKALRRAGIKRSNLYMAWDFTVASDMNIAKRLLHIRDDAFAQLGDTNLADGVVSGSTPSFSVDTVDTNPSTEIARRVRGTFTVPCYLTNGCQAPATFTLDANGNPVQQGTYQANFDCIIPHAAVDDVGAAPGRPSLYGHGLLGSASEVNSSPQRTLAQAHDFVFCATDEIGFSAGDIPNTVGILGDLGRFPELTDRVQQGLLDELLLGRLMDNPSGFLSSPAFHVSGVDTTSAPVIDTSKLYYNGNSQGGILGGALTAVSPDFTRASLGVPAMNYQVLLPRSVDYTLYEGFLKPAYPDPMVRPLALDLVQMLWDRSEPNGYAHRMTTDSLPNTPQHQVLMDVAFGDHQVTDWQADVEARTIGAEAHAPVVYTGRWPNVDALWGIPRISSYPFQGSAIVYWDGGPVRPDPANPSAVLGTDPPPLENVPNRSGKDPHSLPRETPAEQQMVSDFLRPDAASSISDTCNGGPCFDYNFSGP
jgi:hypothetical protein